MNAMDVTKWIGGRNRKHDEAGLDLDRVRILTQSLKEADSRILTWQTELDRLTLYLQSTAKIHIPAAGVKDNPAAPSTTEVSSAEAVRKVMFRSQGRALGWLAVAAYLAEFAIAAMLAPQFLFGMPSIVAVLIAMLIAACLAMGAHGAFVQAFDITSPLRQIRILRLTTNILVSICCLLLAPLLLSRVIVLPGLLLNAPLALLALFLPTCAGVCSALRTILLRAWEAPTRRCDTLNLALETIRSWRRKWDRELVQIGQTDDRQMNLDFPQKTA